jgi:hypothetical protein
MISIREYTEEGYGAICRVRHRPDKLRGSCD